MRTLTLLLALAAAGTVAGQAQVASPHTRLGDRACVDCHQTSDWRAVSFAHERTGYALRGQHRAARCSGCHDLRDFAAARRDCAACHADPHRGDAGTRCETCHAETTWRQIDPMVHARTRLPDLGVHAALRCDDCHRSTGSRPFTGPVSPCAACHQATYDATTNPVHRTLGFSTRCEQCHQLATWDYALFAQHDAIFGIYTGEHAGTWQSCATCHPVANDFRQFTCITCHTQGPTDQEHQGIPGYQWASTACLSCHPGGRGGSIAHDPLFPIFSGAHANQWSACTDCHVDPNTRSVFSCMTGGCHPQAASDATHAQIGGYAYAATQCLACHPDGQGGSFPQHDALFPINTGKHARRWSTCETCHTVPGNRSIFTCGGSGCHSQTQMDDKHRNMNGYSYSPPVCLGCHPQGTKP